MKNDAQKKLFEEVLACMNLSQEEQTYVRANVYSNNGILDELLTSTICTEVLQCDSKLGFDFQKIIPL